jgi:hypothetical protein
MAVLWGGADADERGAPVTEVPLYGSNTDAYQLGNERRL